MRRRSSRGGYEMGPLPGLVVPGRDLRGPGDWESLFGRRAPLVVEAGFGKDVFLLDRAAQFPDQDHVGIERDPARVRAFLRLAGERGLDNVRVLAVSAELALGRCFADGAVAELHVYFPDPWPKTRHRWNRLVRPWFAREASRILVPGGVLYLATDDDPYVEQMLEVLAASPAFEAPRVTRRPQDAEAGSGHRTKFEKLWLRRGRDVRYLEVRTKAPAASVMAS